MYVLRHGNARAAAIAVALSLLVTGCEAPLRLEAVEKNKQEPIRRLDLFQAAADNGQTIAVVGNQGLIVTSGDRGSSWQRHELPGWPGLIDVAACPDGSFVALAIEGQVYRSADQGATWTGQPYESEEEMQDLTCDPRGRIWIVGSFSTLLMSEDTGRSWSATSFEEDLIYTNIQFLDEQVAVVSGEFGAVIKSTDGGDSWEPLEPLPDEFYAQAMYFRDADNGWIVGLGGAVWHTVDGGVSWELQEANTIAPLFGITEAGDDLYVVGGEGVLLRLAGDRWLRLEHGKPIRLFLRAVMPVGDDKLLIAGQVGALYVLPIAELPVMTAAAEVLQ